MHLPGVQLVQIGTLDGWLQTVLQLGTLQCVVQVGHLVCAHLLGQGVVQLVLPPVQLGLGILWSVLLV